MFLPKKIAWGILLALLYYDLALTWSVGKEGNPLWRPLIEKYGFQIGIFLVPLLLLLIISIIKLLAPLITKLDKTPKSEEILSTALVIIYATYNFYITFFVPRIGYLGTSNHRVLIPILIIPGIIYASIAEAMAKKKK